MAFPPTPVDGEIYTTSSGSRYKYYLAQDKWMKDGMVPIGNTGYTGAQGYTGLQGPTGYQGATGLTYGVTGTINVIIDGGGSTVATGMKGDVTLPFAMYIDRWRLLAKETGSILVGLWRNSYANYPPTSADAMHIGETGPNIVAGIKNTATTANWMGATGASQDIVRVDVESSSSITMASLSLDYHKI